MQPYDYIYISPHLDDVVYSCGAQIYQHTSRGQSVMIITLMAGDPDPGQLSDYAKELHRRWQIGSAGVEIRRQEDRSACSLIGARALHWPFMDCIYRQNPVDGSHLYQSDKAIFGPIDSSETGLIASISARIDTLPSGSKIFIPLSVGNHVDHQIARLAASNVSEAESMAYYEDYPYASLDSKALLSFESDPRWRSEVIPVTPEAQELKVKAMTQYRSQLSTFFENEEGLYEVLAEFTELVGGERIWHRGGRVR